MAIIIQEIGLPYISCDSCHSQITGEGNVLWIEGGVPKFYFTHKRCNAAFCRSKFTGAEMKRQQSQGIEDFLNNLFSSLKSKPRK